MAPNHVPVSQGKPPRGPSWVYLGSLGRSAKRDPADWGREIGREARACHALEVRLCKGPFGVLRAYARLPEGSKEPHGA